MIDKRVSSVAAALEGVSSGSTILLGGFGDSGVPFDLIDGLLAREVDQLTLVTNNAGTGEVGIAALLRERRVAKIICSYPRSKGSVWFEKRYNDGELELELVPQGTLTERLRAAGAGLGGFFTPTGAGTVLARGRETRFLDGKEQLFERPLRGDVSLIQADRADRWGNLVYRTGARNFGPTMAAASALTIVQVRQIVELGDLDPESIITPGVFVDRVVEIGH